MAQYRVELDLRYVITVEADGDDAAKNKAEEFKDTVLRVCKNGEAVVGLRFQPVMESAVLEDRRRAGLQPGEPVKVELIRSKANGVEAADAPFEFRADPDEKSVIFACGATAYYHRQRGIRVDSARSCHSDDEHRKMAERWARFRGFSTDSSKA